MTTYNPDLIYSSPSAGNPEPLYAPGLFDTSTGHYANGFGTYPAGYPADITGRVSYIDPTGSIVAGSLPTVVQNPINTTAPNGGPAISFVCTAYGDGGESLFYSAYSTYMANLAALSFDWYQNGILFHHDSSPGLTTTDLITHARSTLSVSGTKPGNDGDTYFCRVTNGSGHTDSTSATLTVLDLPYGLTTLTNKTVNENASFTFGPVSASGPGPFTYQWYLTHYHDLSMYTETIIIPGATTSSYTGEALIYVPALFDHVSAPEWNYYCAVTNAAGTTTTNSASVTVTPTASSNPTLVTNPTNLTRSEGAVVDFSATFGGSHISAHLWTQYGVVSYNPVESSATTFSSNFIATSALNGSTWAATAVNSHGSTQSTFATLTVIAGAPTITSNISGYRVVPIGNLYVSITATGSTPLVFDWYKNGSLAWTDTSPVGGTSTYVDIFPANGSTYFCRVHNGYGSIDSGTVTLVLTLPTTAYRPTTGTGVTTFPQGVDTGSSTTVDTTTYSTHTRGASGGGVRTDTFVFSGFSSSSTPVNGHLNVYATGDTSADDTSNSASISMSYSYTGHSGLNIDSISGDGGVLSDTPWTSSLISGIDLTALTVTVVMTGSRVGVYPDYALGSSQLNLYDIVFITS